VSWGTVVPRRRDRDSRTGIIVTVVPGLKFWTIKKFLGPGALPRVDEYIANERARMDSSPDSEKKELMNQLSRSVVTGFTDCVCKQTVSAN
jgi:hypothetical protein